MLFQVPRYSGKSASSARADHDGVNLSIHLLENFYSGCLQVVFGIGRILELIRHEAFAASGKFFGALDGSSHALRVGRTRHFSTEGPHDNDFFFRKALWYKQRDLITPVDANERQ